MSENSSADLYKKGAEVERMVGEYNSVVRFLSKTSNYDLVPRDLIRSMEVAISEKEENIFNDLYAEALVGINSDADLKTIYNMTKPSHSRQTSKNNIHYYPKTDSESSDAEESDKIEYGSPLAGIMPEKEAEIDL